MTLCPPPPQHQRSWEDSGIFDGISNTGNVRRDSLSDLSPIRSRPLTAPTSKSASRIISYSQTKKDLARSRGDDSCSAPRKHNNIITISLALEIRTEALFRLDT